MLSRYIVLLVIASMSLGCGGSSSSGPGLPEGASEAIAEVREVILDASYGGSPLKSKSDLKHFESRFPKAAAAIESGEIEVVWGGTIRDGANPTPKVIAYEKAAATGEGWAVKDDGNISKVTSAEISGTQK